MESTTHEGHLLLESVARGMNRLRSLVQCGLSDDTLPALARENIRDVSLSVAVLDRQLSAFVAAVIRAPGPAFDYRLDELVSSLPRLSAQTLFKQFPPGGIISLLYHINFVVHDTCRVVEHRATSEQGPTLSNHAATLAALCRLWLVAAEVTTRANALPSTRSYAVLLHAVAESPSGPPSRKTIARELLEDTPLPATVTQTIWHGIGREHRFLVHGLNAYYAGLYVAWTVRKHCPAVGAPLWPLVALLALSWYFLRPRRAALRAGQIMSERSAVEFVTWCWNLLDTPVARHVLRVARPSLPVDSHARVAGVTTHIFANDAPLRVPGLAPTEQGRVVPALLRFVLQSVVQRVRGQRAAERAGAAAAAADTYGVEDSEELSVTAEPSEWHSAGDLLGHGGTGEGGWAPSPGPRRAAAPSCLEPQLPSVYLHTHGGGFVASSFSLDAVWLAKWARSSTETCVVAYPFYALAPAKKHPHQLNQLVQVYLWFRARTPRIVVGGDSAGGNLTAALTLLLLARGLPLPDRLVLMYPALNLHECPSASRALHLHDPLVPVKLLIALADSYTPSPATPESRMDPTLHPSMAGDDALRRFPPTFIACGGLDPLLDDSVDLNTRLRRLGVPGELKVYRTLPHGFMNFPQLPHAEAARKQVQAWVMAGLTQAG